MGDDSAVRGKRTAHLVAVLHSSMPPKRPNAALAPYFFFQAEDGIRDPLVTEFRRVLFRSPWNTGGRTSGAGGCYHSLSQSRSTDGDRRSGVDAFSGHVYDRRDHRHQRGPDRPLTSGRSSSHCAIAVGFGWLTGGLAGAPAAS